MSTPTSSTSTVTRPLRLRWWSWAVLGLALAVVIALAARPTPTSGTSDDRLFSLAAEMKCLACAGESVANSAAPLAVEMRDQIRAQMRRGSTDDEILTYFADRYGERVLLNPSSRGLVSLVWVLPVLVAAASVCGLALGFARWRRLATDVPEVSDEDRRLVDRARRGGRRR